MGQDTSLRNLESTMVLDMTKLTDKAKAIAQKRAAQEEERKKYIVIVTESGLESIEYSLAKLSSYMSHDTEVVAISYWNWRNGCKETQIPKGPIVINDSNPNSAIGNLIPGFEKNPIKGPYDDGDYVYLSIKLAVRQKPIETKAKPSDSTLTSLGAMLLADS